MGWEEGDARKGHQSKCHTFTKGSPTCLIVIEDWSLAQMTDKQTDKHTWTGRMGDQTCRTAFTLIPLYVHQRLTALCTEASSSAKPLPTKESAASPQCPVGLWRGKRGLCQNSLKINKMHVKLPLIVHIRSGLWFHCKVAALATEFTVRLWIWRHFDFMQIATCISKWRDFLRHHQVG